MALMAVGGFLYIKNLGVVECESKTKTVIIKEGKKDIDIDKRQSKILSNRNNYDLSNRLQSGTF